MKNIKFDIKKDFKDEPILIGVNTEPPFNKDAIFYVQGLIFENVDNASRDEIENKNKKLYLSEFNTPVVTDSVNSLLFNIVNLGLHKEMDLISIWSFKEIEDIKNFIDEQQPEILGKLNSDSSKEVIIFEKVNNSDDKIKKILCYSDINIRNAFISEMSDLQYLPVVMLDVENVKKIHMQMIDAMNGSSLYYPEFYFPTPLLGKALQDSIEISDEEWDLLDDEEKEELNKWVKKQDMIQKKQDSKDVFFTDEEFIDLKNHLLRTLNKK